MSKSNYVLAPEPAIDLAIAEAMVDELENYLINDDLYRTVIVRLPSGDENVRMTLGDLFSRFKRLEGEREQLSEAERQRLDSVRQRAESIIYSFRTRALQRMEREIKGRLDSLKWFLDDCNQDRQRCRSEYPFEIRNRQRIQELLGQFGTNLPQPLADRLAQIDNRIRQITHGTGFIWDNRLQAAFPPQPYWYLYVSP